MTRGRPTSDFIKGQVVTLRQQGVSYRLIAKQIKLSKSTVEDVWKRYLETGSHENRPRSGRPPASTSRQDRHLVRMSLQDRFLTAPQLRVEWKESCGVSVSKSTVNCRLVAAGLNGRISRRKPLLTQRHRRLRLEFARQYQCWTVDDWKRVLWSDESKFNLFHSDGRTYVRRRVSEEFSDNCVVPTIKHGGGSVMIWGCFCGSDIGLMTEVNGRMNSQQYCEILSNHMIPSAWSARGLDYIFQQDNASCHSSRYTTEWLKDNNVTVLSWPPQSPDLNPIEHLWEYMERQLQDTHSTNKRQLWLNLRNVWDSIPPTILSHLVESMPSRLEAVIKARGSHTKY